MVQASASVWYWAVAKRADRIAVIHDGKIALIRTDGKRVTMAQTVVIGAGPAGLMAAEQLSLAGHNVLVAEAMPSVGRKFLMAGKSGLNLTKDEPFEKLMEAYGDSAAWLWPVISEMDALAVQNWAKELGQDLFTGSTGRVFPKVMKASPLLRSWLSRLDAAGVQIRTRCRWTGWDGENLIFETPKGVLYLNADATVLALGGASWSRLGSDGKWTSLLAGKDVSLNPFTPSNSALSVDWSHHMQPHFGTALKSVLWSAGELQSRGEAILSNKGLEGGGLYPLTPALRKGAPLRVDLLPDFDPNAIQARISASRSKATLTHLLKSKLRLPAQKIALFYEMTKADARQPDRLVESLKKLQIHYTALRPMDEAISTAGGVSRDAVNDDLMLRGQPGVFCAGEMLDWEAPTGGYLLTGCLATGRWAGRAAADWLNQTDRN